MTTWLCELSHQSFTTWENLCRPCGLARRAIRNDFGQLIWLKVTALRKVDLWCADCDAEIQRRPGYKTPTLEVMNGICQRRLQEPDNLGQVGPSTEGGGILG